MCAQGSRRRPGHADPQPGIPFSDALAGSSGHRWGGQFFYDGGNVYSRLSRISFRTMLPAPRSNLGLRICRCAIRIARMNSTTFAHTIGFGREIQNSGGVHSNDFGYQLNRPSFVIPIPCPKRQYNLPAWLAGPARHATPRFSDLFSIWGRASNARTGDSRSASSRCP